MKTPRTRAGFSLLELAVSVTLLALVFGTTLLIGDSVRDGSSTATAAAKAETDSERAVERLADRLKDSGSGWFGATAPLVPMDDVLYKRVAGYVPGTGAAVVDERIVLERVPTDPDDGIDNDGNGVVDDCRVVWVREPGTASELRTVVCDRVPDALEGEVDGNLLDDNGNGLVDERGLALEFVDAGVRVRLTVSERDQSGRDVVHTVERVVWFRNEAASKK
ncbi:MAG: hypothetical protein L0206_18615 [Actinobacteria bacterium]|nr:hypothetical protein [Actinomycetota bacterium]